MGVTQRPRGGDEYKKRHSLSLHQGKSCSLPVSLCCSLHNGNDILGYWRPCEIVDLNQGWARKPPGLPRWYSGKGSTCHGGDARRQRFDPWVRKISWRRAGQPTPVFLPGESHGQRSLAGYSPWGCKESEKIEHARVHMSVRAQENFPGNASCSFLKVTWPEAPPVLWHPAVQGWRGGKRWTFKSLQIHSAL